MHRRGELGRSGEDSRTRNPYGCNGEYTDPATGFQYLRSRYYNGRTGSFLTEDSHGGNVLEPLSQNRYTYTGNNPLNLKDPGGHAWVSGILGKVKSAASKSTSARPGAVKSGAAAVAKEKIKKIVTSTRNTASTNSQKSKGGSNQKAKGTETAATKFFNATVPSTGSSSGNVRIKSIAAKQTWQQTIANSMNGTRTGTVRRITPGHSYINNKLFTASSARERKQCANAGRATAGAITTAAVAPAIPGVFGGLEALLTLLADTFAAALGGAVLPVVLIGAAVAALGVGVYKYLTEEKVALTPTIAEQILEMARKKKEEQETIKVGPGDYDIINPDGSKVGLGGGGGGENNNDDNNGEEKPAPVNPEPESGGSSSENVQDSSGSIGKEMEGSLWEPTQNKNNLWSKGKLKEHFEKHGDEFGAKSAQEYSDMAVEFGTQKSNNIIQTIYEGFVYRYDPVTNTIFIGTLKGGKVKSFYIWDGRTNDFVINLLKSLGLIK